MIIKLTESTNPKGFKPGELIRKQELDTVKRFINDRLKQIDCVKNDTITKDELEKQRFNDAISVFGCRGSGKTSFLESVLTKYTKDENVFPLDLLDPTLIEEKGHVFLTILSMIKEVVEKELKTKDRNCSDKGENVCCLKKHWNEKLKKLSAGLPLLDGLSEKYEYRQDPEYVMETGLRDTLAAKNLQKNFNELLRYALEDILHKKVFVLALDDIDICFQKGWAVLETVRKYLTSPYIVVLLSGDSKILSLSIRKEQWSNFGKALLKNEAEQLNRLPVYNDIVTEMEDQYMQKVLQPTRRIYLGTIYELLKNNPELYVEFDGTQEPIKTTYSKLLKTFGFENKEEKAIHSKFFLNLPIRTQIQFLLESKKKDNLTAPFLSDLLEKKVDATRIEQDATYLVPAILKLLVENEVLENSASLLPVTSDESLNRCMVALSLLFSQKVKDNPFLIFDYIIRVGAISQLSQQLHSSIVNNYGYLNCKAFAHHLVAFSRNILLKNGNGDNLFAGDVPIYALNEVAKQKPEKSKFRIDVAFSQETELKDLVFSSLTISKYAWKSDSVTSFSFNVLMATIAEILQDKQLNELSDVPVIMMPDNKTDIPEEAPLPIDNKAQHDETNNSDSEKSLNELIQNWKTQKGITVSVPVLSRCIKRFFKAISNYNMNLKEDKLGNIVEMYIFIFLNSVLIEELLENNIEPSSRNNPLESVDVFFQNFKQKTDNEVTLPLFDWLLKCPLFVPFISNNTGLIDRLPAIDNDCPSVFERMNEVFLLKNRIKINFYYDRRTYSRTKEHLEKNGILNIFLDENQEITELIKSLRSYFTGVIDETKVKTVRDLINKEPK